MEAWSAITCWSRHWTLGPWIRPYSRSLVPRLVLENRTTSSHYYSIKSMLTTSRTGTRTIPVEEVNRHWSISTHLVTDQKTKIIQLRRSKLSKRRILLRNDRLILLDKTFKEPIFAPTSWTHFILIPINSSRCPVQQPERKGFETDRFSHRPFKLFQYNQSINLLRS
jgi:hypothetical protein